MNKVLLRSIIATLLLVATAAFGQQTGAAAPVPAAFLSARTIFISSGGSDAGPFPSPFSGDENRACDEFCRELQARSHYQIVSDSAQADFVPELRPLAPCRLTKANKVQGAADPRPQFRLEICQGRTHYVPRTLTQSIPAAILQKTHDRNFDEGLTQVVKDFEAPGQTAGAESGSQGRFERAGGIVSGAAEDELAGGLLPGRNRALVHRQIAVLYAIIEVSVADGAESFVVEGDGACDFLYLFDELMEGFKLVGGRGELGLAGVEELLVAVIVEMGNLAADDEAGADSHAQAGFVLRALKDDGAAVLRDADAVCVPGDGLNIELETSEFAENLVEGAAARLFEHDFPEDGAKATLILSGCALLSGSHKRGDGCNFRWRMDSPK
ncbi:MAG TPA: hypothetical protein VME18_07000 [Acidobacteriaceae bacterium]|nr:hypothetical protein [Acidobacteriaceae bacterium]